MTNIQLQGALRASSLHALLIMIAKALSRSGYGDVQFLDRRNPREKSRHGGHELLCEATIGTRAVKIIVKVLRDSIRIRNLDEMAGTVMRMGADSGVIISPFHTTKVAQTLLEKYRPRTEVVDGEALAAMLEARSIGVRNKGEVDYAYFGELEHLANQISHFIYNVTRNA